MTKMFFNGKCIKRKKSRIFFRNDLIFIVSDDNNIFTDIGIHNVPFFAVGGQFHTVFFFRNYLIFILSDDKLSFLFKLSANQRTNGQLFESEYLQLEYLLFCVDIELWQLFDNATLFFSRLQQFQSSPFTVSIKFQSH